MSAIPPSSYATARYGRRFYLYYYRGLQSGGPEAIHQLAQRLESEGASVWLVPTPDTRKLPEVGAYATYRCSYVDVIPDDASSVVLAPEVAISLLARFRRASTAVWWLSVDFAEPYRWDFMRRRHEFDRTLRAKIWIKSLVPCSGVLGPRRLSTLIQRSSHFAQSTYAANYVHQHEHVTTMPLSDYISSGQSPLLDTPRGRTVAFNPRKGAQIVQTIMPRMPEIEWRPIQNMSRSQVDDLLRDTAIYLDLGYHPGKDRIPREAALAGCVVIVSNLGSAANTVDVPLKDDYRVDLHGKVDDIVNNSIRVIRRVLEDPIDHRMRQSELLSAIKGERETFEQEVRVFLAHFNGNF